MFFAFAFGLFLKGNIKVLSVNGQDEIKNSAVGGRNVILDVHALDEDGSEMDIEVQGNSEGAHVKRARFHSSMVDSRMLRAGQKFRELKDSYVIFIYKHDKFQRGLPIYHVDRYVSETREPFGDGAHIVYVNGNYKGEYNHSSTFEGSPKKDLERDNEAACLLGTVLPPKETETNTITSGKWVIQVRVVRVPRYISIHVLKKKRLRSPVVNW